MGEQIDWLQIIILSFLQGLTEFLPISSSAHLVIPSQIGIWSDQGLTFDVAVHFGSLFAVIIYFRSEVRDLIHQFFALIGKILAFKLDFRNELGRTEDTINLVHLVVATIPILLAGFILKDIAENQLRSLPIIATSTILFGLILWLADSKRTIQKNQTRMNMSRAFLIGIAQIAAIIPGASRSGVTISAALFLGMDRERASKFSIMLGIPTICGAMALLTSQIPIADLSSISISFVGAVLISFSVAYASIHYFLKYVSKWGFFPFVIYRLCLGTFLFYFSFSA